MYVGVFFLIYIKYDEEYNGMEIFRVLSVVLMVCKIVIFYVKLWWL